MTARQVHTAASVNQLMRLTDEEAEVVALVLNHTNFIPGAVECHLQEFVAIVRAVREIASDPGLG